MCSCLGLCGSRRVCQGTIKLLPSQKKLVYNQGDTRLQLKERINIQVCDLHQTKQGREGPLQSLFAITSSWSGRTWTFPSPNESPFCSASSLQEQLVPGASERLLPMFSGPRITVSFQHFSQKNRCYWCSTVSMSKGAHAEARAGLGCPGLCFLQLSLQREECSPALLH